MTAWCLAPNESRNCDLLKGATLDENSEEEPAGVFADSWRQGWDSRRNQGLRLLSPAPARTPRGSLKSGLYWQTAAGWGGAAGRITSPEGGGLKL